MQDKVSRFIKSRFNKEGVKDQMMDISKDYVAGKAKEFLGDKGKEVAENVIGKKIPEGIKEKIVSSFDRIKSKDALKSFTSEIEKTDHMMGMMKSILKKAGLPAAFIGLSSKFALNWVGIKSETLSKAKEIGKQSEKKIKKVLKSKKLKNIKPPETANGIIDKGIHLFRDNLPKIFDGKKASKLVDKETFKIKLKDFIDKEKNNEDLREIALSEGPEGVKKYLVARAKANFRAEIIGTTKEIVTDKVLKLKEYFSDSDNELIINVKKKLNYPVARIEQIMDRMNIHGKERIKQRFSDIKTYISVLENKLTKVDYEKLKNNPTKLKKYLSLKFFGKVKDVYNKVKKDPKINKGVFLTLIKVTKDIWTDDTENAGVLLDKSLASGLTMMSEFFKDSLSEAVKNIIPGQFDKLSKYFALKNDTKNVELIQKYKEEYTKKGFLGMDDKFGLLTNILKSGVKITVDSSKAILGNEGMEVYGIFATDQEDVKRLQRKIEAKEKMLYVQMKSKLGNLVIKSFGRVLYAGGWTVTALAGSGLKLRSGYFASKELFSHASQMKLGMRNSTSRLYHSIMKKGTFWNKRLNSSHKLAVASAIHGGVTVQQMDIAAQSLEKSLRNALEQSKYLKKGANDKEFIKVFEKIHGKFTADFLKSRGQITNLSERMSQLANKAKDILKFPKNTTGYTKAMAEYEDMYKILNNDITRFSGHLDNISGYRKTFFGRVLDKAKGVVSTDARMASNFDTGYQAVRGTLKNIKDNLDAVNEAAKGGNIDKLVVKDYNKNIGVIDDVLRSTLASKTGKGYGEFLKSLGCAGNVIKEVGKVIGTGVNCVFLGMGIKELLKSGDWIDFFNGGGAYAVPIVGELMIILPDGMLKLWRDDDGTLHYIAKDSPTPLQAIGQYTNPVKLASAGMASYMLFRTVSSLVTAKSKTKAFKGLFTGLNPLNIVKGSYNAGKYTLKGSGHLFEATRQFLSNTPLKYVTTRPIEGIAKGVHTYIFKPVYEKTPFVRNAVDYLKKKNRAMNEVRSATIEHTARIGKLRGKMDNIYKKAIDYTKKNKGVSFEDALKSYNKELTNIQNEISGRTKNLFNKNLARRVSHGRYKNVSQIRQISEKSVSSLKKLLKTARKSKDLKEVAKLTREISEVKYARCCLKWMNKGMKKLHRTEPGIIRSLYGGLKKNYWIKKGAFMMGMIAVHGVTEGIKEKDWEKGLNKGAITMGKGMLSMIPVYGTYKDAEAAITGVDIYGEKLNMKGRIVAGAFAVVGLASDILLIAGGSGAAVRAGASSLRASKWISKLAKVSKVANKLDKGADILKQANAASMAVKTSSKLAKTLKVLRKVRNYGTGLTIGFMVGDAAYEFYNKPVKVCSYNYEYPKEAGVDLTKRVE